jgi:hypothetical protein
MLSMLYGIIDSYQTAPGTGLPIGNLTSQYFANLYLSKIDHYILEQVKPQGYCRYMDDFVLWGADKSTLKAMLEKTSDFTAAELRLVLKQPVLGKTEQGLPFLGFTIKPSGIYLMKKSKRRMMKRIEEIKRDLGWAPDRGGRRYPAYQRVRGGPTCQNPQFSGKVMVRAPLRARTA